MPYCRQENILWIHIPKTGGASIYIYFMRKYGKDKISLLSGIRNKILPTQELQNVSLQHQTYNTIFKYKELLNVDFNNNLKIISVVRNPYNRLISDLFGFNFINEHSSKDEVLNIIKTNYINNNNLDNHNLPQYKFICDDNDNIIKNINIFKQETLTQDMIKYGYTNFNVHFGSTKSKQIDIDESEYISFLNNDSINLINEYYHKDFVLFNYKKL